MKNGGGGEREGVDGGESKIEGVKGREREREGERGGGGESAPHGCGSARESWKKRGGMDGAGGGRRRHGVSGGSPWGAG